MFLSLIDYNFPIWEISDWELPDIDHTGLKTETYDQSSKHYKSSDLRQHLNIELDMLTQGKQIQKMLNKNNLVVIDQMWKGHLERLQWPKGSTNILLDKPGFNMGVHVDNRYVLGVLIINLQDNPIGSGTYFPELKYSGPTKKGTGLFFLNNDNTPHKVYQPGPEDRLIAYQTLTLDDLRYD